MSIAMKCELSWLQMAKDVHMTVGFAANTPETAPVEDCSPSMGLVVITIDILGLLSEMATENPFIIVISDRYTMLTQAPSPLKLAARHVASAFFNH